MCGQLGKAALSNSMHLDILDDQRSSLLPLVRGFKSRFYLAGGTALALQIGHRDSIDFDFFSPESFDTAELFAECEKVFAGHVLKKTQDERDTLSILVDNIVSISFLGFPYPLIESLVVTENLDLASTTDIGCMKLSAITSRSAMKDYVDLYFILQSVPLSKLLDSTATKFATLDRNLILKSLVYFEDIKPEAIRFMPGHELLLDEIKGFLQKLVRDEVDRSRDSSSL